MRLSPSPRSSQRHRGAGLRHHLNQPLPSDGVRAGRKPGGPHREPSPAGPCDRDHAAGRRGGRSRACEGHRAPRHQAGQHPPVRRRQREACRLRYRFVRGCHQPNGYRGGSRVPEIHLAGAGDGRARTPHADVYAMGVVLYELLSSRLPFEGANPTAIAISHVEEDPERLSVLLPELDPQLDALVVRCLVKQPEARFADGNELAAALDDPNFGMAAMAFVDEEDTTSFAPVAGAGAAEAGGSWAAETWARVMAGVGQMGGARSSLLKKVAAAVVLVVLLVLIGIHLTSQPGVAEPGRQVSSSQPVSHHKKELSSVTSSPSTTPTTVTVTSSPTTSRPHGPHKSPKPKHSAPSTSVTVATTSTSAPSTTSSTTTTSAPASTPTPTATAPAH